jgi:3-hydroxyisobutyrate dehydrogenase-like beta-hydroxyacid dehydrogenase
MNPPLSPPSATQSERVGVLGLGIIGSAWAEHYEAAGILAASWNRTPKPELPRAAPDPASVARVSSVLHIAVADPPAVRGLLSAVDGELGERHLVIQSSTIDPASSAEFSERVRARGASYVEVPFMGSRPAAEQRKIVFLMGGAGAALERADAVLGHLSPMRHRVGSERQAAALKLAFNLQVAITIQGICESLHAARSAGLEDAAFFGILQQTGLWSGFQGMKQSKLSQADFAPQFSIKHMLKDVRLANALAGAEATPAAQLVERQLAQAVESGFAEQDIAALIQVL